jgi:hypothetical protein
MMGATHGLGADLVQEINVVTPDGKLVTTNKCSHPDLFWALRGGGGATFGVIVNMTISAPLSEPVTAFEWATLVLPNSTHFWDIAAYTSKSYTTLLDNGIMGYGRIVPSPNSTTSGTLAVAWFGLNMTAVQIQSLLVPVEAYINKTWPGETSIVSSSSSYSSVYEYWSANPDTSTPNGIDLLIGSRLIDKKALAKPDLATYLQNATQPAVGLSLLLVGGPGVHSKPQSLNSVCPGWRSSYIHISQYSQQPLISNRNLI